MNEHTNGTEEFASGTENYLREPEGWFNELIDHGVSDDTATGIESLLSKDTVLGNLTRDEAEALRLLSKNIVEYIEAEHPPEGSMIRGPVRAAFLGSSSEGLEPLRSDQRTNLRTTQMAYELRLSRSIDGFQQKRMGEQRQVSELEDHRPEGRDGGSLSDKIGGLFT